MISGSTLVTSPAKIKEANRIASDCLNSTQTKDSEDNPNLIQIADVDNEQSSISLGSALGMIAGVILGAAVLARRWFSKKS